MVLLYADKEVGLQRICGQSCEGNESDCVWLVRVWEGLGRRIAGAGVTEWEWSIWSLRYKMEVGYVVE